MTKSCGNCARGWIRENGAISCGAGVNDAALAGDCEGINPIWAERKYDPSRVTAMLTGNLDLAAEPLGSDCENMAPADGKDCNMWKLELSNGKA